MTIRTSANGSHEITRWAHSPFLTTPDDARWHTGTPRRFDALWVSPELDVKSVAYKYAAAVAAGTDHALVVADLA